MSRMGTTKSKIVDMLRTKPTTLTALSTALELAPSTVSQHLVELESAGIVTKIDTGRKWKYYELTSRQGETAQKNYQSMRRIAISITIAAAAALVAVALLISSSGNGANAAQIYIKPGANVPVGSTLLTVSDAPLSGQYNISDLYVTIGGARIRSTNGRWYNLSVQSGTFDLAKLDNISKLLADTNLASGSYDMVVLNISSVVATVNGTNQSVPFPRHGIRITGAYNVSGNSTNWINVDFSLANSIRVTDSGQIVMVPSVSVMDSEISGRVEMNESMIAKAKGEVERRSDQRYGQELNGTTMQNYTVPENALIHTDGEGRLTLIKGSQGANITVGRAKHGHYDWLDIEIEHQGGAPSANATAGVSNESVLNVATGRGS